MLSFNCSQSYVNIINYTVPLNNIICRIISRMLNKYIRGNMKVIHIGEKKTLRWFGHVMRKERVVRTERLV